MKEYILEQLEQISRFLGLRLKFSGGFSVRFETDAYNLEKSKKEIAIIEDGNRVLEVYWEDPEDRDSGREFICDVYEAEDKAKSQARLYKGLLSKIKDGTLDIKRYMKPFWKDKYGDGVAITSSGLIIPK